MTKRRKPKRRKRPSNAYDQMLERQVPFMQSLTEDIMSNVANHLRSYSENMNQDVIRANVLTSVFLAAATTVTIFYGHDKSEEERRENMQRIFDTVWQSVMDAIEEIEG